LIVFPDLFLLVIGGIDSSICGTDDVELISLDPKRNPIPARYRKLQRFPKKIWWGGGASFAAGSTQRFGRVAGGGGWNVFLPVIRPLVILGWKPKSKRKRHNFS
jgi:hypothetical protein